MSRLPEVQWCVVHNKKATRNSCGNRLAWMFGGKRCNVVTRILLEPLDPNVVATLTKEGEPIGKEL